MKLSNDPAKYEVLIKQYLHSIISGLFCHFFFKIDIHHHRHESKCLSLSNNAETAENFVANQDHTLYKTGF